jgi:hypothetical protein
MQYIPADLQLDGFFGCGQRYDRARYFRSSSQTAAQQLRCDHHRRTQISKLVAEQ